MAGEEQLQDCDSGCEDVDEEMREELAETNSDLVGIIYYRSCALFTFGQIDLGATNYLSDEANSICFQLVYGDQVEKNGCVL